jgi:hypothetical protein
VRELIDMVGAAGPDSFWTVAPVRRANEVRIPGGHRQVARRSLTVRRHARQLQAADQPTVSPQRTHAAAQV